MPGPPPLQQIDPGRQQGGKSPAEAASARCTSGTAAGSAHMPKPHSLHHLWHVWVADVIMLGHAVPHTTTARQRQTAPRRS